MCGKVEITESVKNRLEKVGVDINEGKSDAEVIADVNKSKIAVARYDENDNKVTIKESLNG